MKYRHILDHGMLNAKLCILGLCSSVCSVAWCLLNLPNQKLAFLAPFQIQKIMEGHWRIHFLPSFPPHRFPPVLLCSNMKASLHSYCFLPSISSFLSPKILPPSSFSPYFSITTLFPKEFRFFIISHIGDYY